MSEENEMMMLLKELVDKVKSLEKAVFNDENLLMKSGYVVTNTPTPVIAATGTEMNDDKIAKMEWKEINAMVSRIEGGI